MESFNKTKKQLVLGFTLLETIIYLGIFITAASFIVGIFFTFTGVHQRQTSINEVNRQISFVNSTINRLVGSSSLIEMPAGVSTSTLTLRMRQTQDDKTIVWHDTENQRIMLQEGEGSPVAITDNNVVVSHFSVIKIEQPGALDVAQISMTIDFNSENPKEKFKRTANTAVSRATAATFDSNILPGVSELQIGDSSNKWLGYFSGIGINTDPNMNASIRASGNIAVTASSSGFVAKSPNGTCFKFTPDDSGNWTSSSISCP